MRSLASRILFTLSLALVLVACEISNAPTADRVAIQLIASDNGHEGFSTLGVPTYEDGTPVPDTIEIIVYTSSGEQVMFDSNNNMVSSGGIRDRLQMSTANAAAGVSAFLRPGVYDFEARARIDDIFPVVVAHTLVEEFTANRDSTLFLPLEAVIGSVEIEAATPIEFLVPGQTVDLLISVLSPDNVSRVPLADYTATYDFMDGSTLTGSSLGSSALGVRAVADDTGTLAFFTASVEVSGKVDEGGTVIQGSRRATITFPFTVSTKFFADVEAPWVTLESAELIRGSTGTLSGIAGDRLGVTKLQVFEGPILIGSSDSSEYGVESVEQVSFSAGTWQLPFTPETTGTLSFTAVAFDFFGNTSRATRTVSVSASPL